MDGAHFRPVDIGRPFDLGRVFDMAVCVEVAEHLAAERADGFVADLVKHASAIVFSAATPLQGGIHHVNEQWPDYWIRRFEQHGFTCWDVFRPLIRYDRSVAWIYRQNLMLVLGPGHPGLEDVREDQRLTVPDDGDSASSTWPGTCWIGRTAWPQPCDGYPGSRARQSATVSPLDEPCGVTSPRPPFVRSEVHGAIVGENCGRRGPRGQRSGAAGAARGDFG